MSLLTILKSANTDIWEDQGAHYVAYVPVPGVPEGMVTVQLSGTTITISGSVPRTPFNYQRILTQPAGTGNVTARYDSGMIIVTAHKQAVPISRSLLMVGGAAPSGSSENCM